MKSAEWRVTECKSARVQDCKSAESLAQSAESLAQTAVSDHQIAGRPRFFHAPSGHRYRNACRTMQPAMQLVAETNGTATFFGIALEVDWDFSGMLLRHSRCELCRHVRS